MDAVTVAYFIRWQTRKSGSRRFTPNAEYVVRPEFLIRPGAWAFSGRLEELISSRMATK